MGRHHRRHCDCDHGCPQGPRGYYTRGCCGCVVTVLVVIAAIAALAAIAIGI